MELKRAIGRVSNRMANFDVRFACLNDYGESIEYIAPLKDMAFAWKHSDESFLVPENGAIIRGLMFVDQEGAVIMVNSQDTSETTFEDLMRMVFGQDRNVKEEI